MPIEVLIKRSTRQGESAKILLPYIIELRAHAVKQAGYISGETLFNIDQSEECLVVSRWVALEHWQEWMRNPLRIKINGELEKFLDTKSEYNIYGVSLW